MWTQSDILDLISRKRADYRIDLEPPASAQQISDCENRLGLSFPHELRAWLTVCNGATTPFGALYGVPIAKDKEESGTIESIASIWSNAGWLQKRWIPIGTDGCGNFYMCVRDPQASMDIIAFVDTMEDPQRLSYAVASDLYSFFAGFFLTEVALDNPLLGQNLWPFDKTWAEKYDPRLFQVKAAELPWDTD
jgi:cell wall assembly regulator SMI1